MSRNTGAKRMGPVRIPRAFIILVLFVIAHGVYGDGGSADGPVQVDRCRFLVGFGLGAGYISTNVENENDQVTLSPSMGWKVGWFLSHDVAVELVFPSTLFDYTGNPDAPRQRLRGFEGIIPSIQYWPGGDRWWMMAGLGLSMDTPVFYDVRGEDEGVYYYGTGGIFAVGYELKQWETGAIDIQTRVRYGTANVPEGTRRSFAVDVLVGLNWY